MTDAPTRTGSARSARREAVLYAGLIAFASPLAIWSLGLFSRTWSIPLFYTSDALSAGAAYKGTLTFGWYERNPELGAPYGQNLHAFPNADNLQFVLIRLAGLFTSDWAVASNVVHVLGFPLAAACGAYFFRAVGLGRVASFAAAVLFAFAPYHYVQGYGHLSLSLYFPVALAAVALVRPLVGEPVWTRGHGRPGVRWMTPRTLGTLLALVLMGTTSSYYSVFTLLLLGFVALIVLLRRQIARLVEVCAAGVVLVLVMLLNMAPDMLYRGPHNYLSFTRQPLESELYALKFAALVLPTPWSRVGGLGAWRMTYEATYPVPSERPVLGIVAAVGFVFLLVHPLLAQLVRRRPAVPTVLQRRLNALSGLTFVAFMLGTVGGFATLFAILVSPSIRAWNRIVIFLMLFALAAVFLLVEAGLGRLAERRRLAGPRRWVALVLASAVVTGIGLFDQVAPSTWALVGDEQQVWASDASFAARIQEKMPTGSMILELPFLAYPESQPVNELKDYDPIRPYLHTSGLRWTYGGVKGYPHSSWSARVADLAPDRMLVSAAAAGVSGIYVDRFGYPGRDTALLEKGLADMTGDAPIVSDDGRYAFFDVRSYAERVRSDLHQGDLHDLRASVLDSPELFWQTDWQEPHLEGDVPVRTSLIPNPAVAIGNPGRARTFRLAFTIRADGEAGPEEVVVTWPDRTSDTVTVPPEGRKVRRTFLLPAGESALRLTRAGTAPVSVIHLRFVDTRREHLEHLALVASHR